MGQVLESSTYTSMCSGCKSHTKEKGVHGTVDDTVGLTRGS